MGAMIIIIILWLYILGCALIGMSFLMRVTSRGITEGIFGIYPRKYFWIKAIAKIAIIVVFFPSIIFFIIGGFLFLIAIFIEEGI